MRILITIIITVCVAIGLGIFLKDDPGRLVFTYAGTTVQTSFAFFLILLIVSFISLYYLFSFIGSLIKLPKQFRRWSGHRRLYCWAPNHRFAIQARWLTGAFPLTDCCICRRPRKSANSNPLIDSPPGRS